MSAESRRVVVDPITRIEGHLRIEAQTDADRRITQAYSSGTMVRGIEIILRGRDPRDAWAFAQRICGVCTLVHGIASVRAVEDALQLRDPAQRATDPQPDDRRAVRARPRDALLSPARARLGGRGLGAEGRPEGRPRPLRKVDQQLCEILARATSPTCRRSVQGLRRERAARHLRQRLLGPPGLQAAAGSQPDGGGALSRCARLAARRGQAAHHLRRQESAPEFRGRRRAVPDRPRVRFGDQRQAPVPGAGHHPAHARVRRSGLCAGHAGHRRLLQGLGDAGRRPRQFPVLRRLPGASRSSNRRLPGAARRHPESRPVAHPGSRPPRPTQIQEFVAPLLVRLRRRQGPRACIRTRAKRRSTTPARSRPIRTSTSTGAIPG